MNIFEFRNSLVRDYESYIKSFIQIRDQRIKECVEQALELGALWPEPLIQLNPSFEPGDWIEDLIKQGILHSECSRVFRKDKTEQGNTGTPLRLHRH